MHNATYSYNQRDVIEDISIKLSKDYTKDLKVIKATVNQGYFKLEEEATVTLNKPCERNSPADSNEMLGQELHQNECCPLKGTDLKEKNPIIDCRPPKKIGEENLLTQRELIEKMVAHIEKKSEDLCTDEKQKTLITCGIGWIEEKKFKMKKKKGTEEKGSLIPQHDLFGNVVVECEKKESNKETEEHQEIPRLLRSQSKKNVLTKKEKGEANGGLLHHLQKEKKQNFNSNVRKMSRKPTTTTKGNKAHKKTFHGAIHFIKPTKFKDLMKKNKNKRLTLNLNRYCEINFAKGIDTSESVGGAVINFCGAAIDWKTKRQRTVLLSSTEADSEVAADITANEKNYPIETTADMNGAHPMKNDTIGQFELKIDKPCDANGPCGEQENSASKMKNRKGVENSGVVFPLEAEIPHWRTDGQLYM